MHFSPIIFTPPNWIEKGWNNLLIILKQVYFIGRFNFSKGPYTNHVAIFFLNFDPPPPNVATFATMTQPILENFRPPFPSYWLRGLSMASIMCNEIIYISNQHITFTRQQIQNCSMQSIFLRLRIRDCCALKSNKKQIRTKGLSYDR